jgi:hypothetical protein
MPSAVFYVMYKREAALCWGVSMDVDIEWQEYEYDLACGAHVKVLREIVYLPKADA